MSKQVRPAMNTPSQNSIESVLTYMTAVSIAIYTLAMAYGLTHLSV